MMIEINLLAQDLRLKARKSSLTSLGPRQILYLIPLFLGLLVYLHLHLAISGIVKNKQLSLLKKKWEALEPERKRLAATLEQGVEAERIIWAEKLNNLSLALPSGVWLNELSVSSKDFILKGSAISFSGQEMNLIKGFIDNLKKDNSFFKDFLSLELGSVQRRLLAGYEVAEFIFEGAIRVLDDRP